jgi:hypothetical protein
LNNATIDKPQARRFAPAVCVLGLAIGHDRRHQLDVSAGAVSVGGRRVISVIPKKYRLGRALVLNMDI